MMLMLLSPGGGESFEQRQNSKHHFFFFFSNQLSVNKDRMECEETWDLLIHSKQQQPEESWKVFRTQQLLHHLRLLGGAFNGCGMRLILLTSSSFFFFWGTTTTRATLSKVWETDVVSLTFSDHNPLGVNTLQVLCVWNQNHINYKLVNLSQSLVRLVLKYKLGGRGGGGPTVALASTTTSITLDTPQQHKTSPLVCRW